MHCSIQHCSCVFKKEVMAAALFHVSVFKDVQEGGHGGCTVPYSIVHVCSRRKSWRLHCSMQQCSSMYCMYKEEFMAVTLFHATVLKHVQVKGHCGCTQEEVYLEYNVRSVVPFIQSTRISG